MEYVIIGELWLGDKGDVELLYTSDTKPSLEDILHRVGPNRAHKYVSYKIYAHCGTY